MIDDNNNNLVNPLDGAIHSAFDRWGQRFNEEFFKNLQSKDEATRKEAFRKFYNVQLFLEKRALIPGFNQLVLTEMKKNSFVKKQRKVLLRACIISIVGDTGVTVSDILAHQSAKKEGQENDDDSNPEYVRRHIQRLLHEKHRHTFYESETGNKKSADGRFNYFSSVFSPTPLPAASETEMARAYSESERSIALSDPNKTALSWNMVNLQFVMPEFMEDMIDFRNECDDAFVNLKIEGKGNRREKEKFVKFVRIRLTSITGLLYTFYWFFTSILAVAYFEHLKEEGKRNLVDSKPKFQYPPDYPHRARNCLALLTGSDDDAISYFMPIGATSLQNFGHYEHAISVFEECLKSEIGDKQRGITHENIAVVHRTQGSYDKMLTSSMQALKYYEKSGDGYRVCVCMKNIAEAQYMLGLKDDALKGFQAAGEKSRDLPSRQQYGVYGNISKALRRCGDFKAELHYLKKCLEVASDDIPTEEILAINDRIDELLHLR